MKTKTLLTLLFLAGTLRAADRPTGQQTPEGVACDAVAAYIDRDSKAWLATLVRPIYGPEGDKQYAEFKKEMAEKADKAKEDKDYKAPRIVKCYKARGFTMEGPASAAFALGSFIEDMFVDVIMETPEGKIQRLRYHVLQDKDKKWYFEPRPDLCPLYSMGLNTESESKEVLYEAK